MEKVCARIFEMHNRCKLVVESSGRARYSNIEEEIGYFGVSLEYAPVPSILTPPGAVCRKELIDPKVHAHLNIGIGRILPKFYSTNHPTKCIVSWASAYCALSNFTLLVHRTLSCTKSTALVKMYLRQPKG